MATIGAITHGCVPVRSAASGDRVELPVEDAGVVEGDAQAAHAQRGVRLVRHPGEGQRLVGAGVERAHDDLAPRERLEHLGVDRRLLARRSARSRRRGSTARCGTGRRPRRRLAAAARAPAPSCTLASTSTRAPSEVPPGPVQPAVSVALLAAPRRPPPGVAGSGSQLDRTGRAVDEDEAADRDLVDTGTATTQGIPSWRAMIAVWLVGPPSVVAMPTTSAGSSPAVSAGARSSATRTDGSSGIGHARLGLARELGDDPVADVVEVGDPLGHQPAHRAEHAGELVDRGRRRAHARQCRRRSAWRPSRAARGRGARPAVAGSTSAATPLAAARPALKPAATTSAAAVKRAASAGRRPPATSCAAGRSRAGPAGPDRPGRSRRPGRPACPAGCVRCPWPAPLVGVAGAARTVRT